MSAKRVTKRARKRTPKRIVRTTVPDQVLDSLRIDDIDLDPLNPRLPEDVQGASQDELLLFIAQEYAPLEIAGSIARHGYFISEPIIVFEQGGRAIAVEGNRRLTALKLLATPEKAVELGLEDAEAWDTLAVGALLPPHVPVVRINSREAVAPLVGYRHISGIEPWEPFAKARFLTNLIDRDRMSFEEAATVVGEPERSVREHYRNFRITQQLSSRFSIDTTKVVSRFGVFTRAMQDSRILAHINAPASAAIEVVSPTSSILPSSARGNANEIVRWVFGADDHTPLFTDSRKILMLGAVLASKPALDSLRLTGNLDDAFEIAGGPQQQVIGILDRATSLLNRAATIADATDAKKLGDEVRKAMDRCRAALASVQKAVS